MLRSFRIGRAFGIPVYIHTTFLLLPILILSLQGAAGWLSFVFQTSLVLAIFGCVLLHELGHALMARYFGIPTRDITLYPIGGVARLEKLSETPHEEVLIALAGPAVNVLIAILLAPVGIMALLGGAVGTDGLVAQPGEGLSILLGRLAFGLWLSNIVLFLFNLLPVFPMDGGRVLRAVLASIFPHLRATEIAAKVGLFLALLLGILGVMTHHYMLVALAVFVVFAGQQELLALRHRQAAREEAWGDSPAGEPRPQVHVRMGPQLNAGFTGFVWDRQLHVWVKWQDGRPVAAYWGRVE